MGAKRLRRWNEINYFYHTTIGGEGSSFVCFNSMSQTIATATDEVVDLLQTDVMAALRRGYHCYTVMLCAATTAGLCHGMLALLG